MYFSGVDSFRGVFFVSSPIRNPLQSVYIENISAVSILKLGTTKKKIKHNKKCRK